MLIACCVPYFNTSHVTVYLTHYQTGISITIFQYISCYCLSLLPFRLYDPVLLFQYISCYCLSSPGFNVGLSYSRFQYISCYCLSLIGVHFQRGHRISIHLMLLFIISGFIIPRVKCHFNTSHVTVYLGHRVMELIKDIFQYISCYCLSPELTRSRNIYEYFNTSHVTVYPEGEKTMANMNLFQYISCYCLSTDLCVWFLRCNTFQYISCYCLSDRSESATVSSTDISIHLMLLFITANIIQIYIICQISIHLMLLFIQVVGVM